MHSEIGAWREAREIFVGPSRLAERLMRRGPALVIYDLGLGIAANALAALLEWRKARAPKRALRIVSFENDPSGLELALATRAGQPEFLGEEASSLLKHGRWESDEVTWELKTGDFREAVLGTGEAELVFHDFYAPKVEPGLWDVGTFERLRRALAPSGLLLTYSAASSVRRVLEQAGFHVGRGPGTELKRESTHASLDLQELAEPLPKRYNFTNAPASDRAVSRDPHPRGA
jgi:tRNA U34 5-methylaminomethyl-2-thiouridine-forming methyltransferase MnmC